MTKKVIFFSAILILLIVGIVLINIFAVTHTAHLKMVDKREAVSVSEAIDSNYFFIKDDSYQGFYDGVLRLQEYIPDYDISALNTQEYTYVVSVNCKIEEITYSGRACKRRTLFVFPDVYTANVTVDNTSDNMLRIYRMKKINIDYDYHNAGLSQ